MHEVNVSKTRINSRFIWCINRQHQASFSIDHPILPANVCAAAEQLMLFSYLFVCMCILKSFANGVLAKPNSFKPIDTYWLIQNDKTWTVEKRVLNPSSSSYVRQKSWIFFRNACIEIVWYMSYDLMCQSLILDELKDVPNMNEEDLNDVHAWNKTINIVLQIDAKHWPVEKEHTCTCLCLNFVSHRIGTWNERGQSDKYECVYARCCYSYMNVRKEKEQTKINAFNYRRYCNQMNTFPSS